MCRECISQVYALNDNGYCKQRTLKLTEYYDDWWSGHGDAREYQLGPTSDSSPYRLQILLGKSMGDSPLSDMTSEFTTPVTLHCSSTVGHTPEDLWPMSDEVWAKGMTCMNENMIFT